MTSKTVKNEEDPIKSKENFTNVYEVLCFTPHSRGIQCFTSAENEHRPCCQLLLGTNDLCCRKKKIYIRLFLFSSLLFWAQSTTWVIWRLTTEEDPRLFVSEIISSMCQPFQGNKMEVANDDNDWILQTRIVGKVVGQFLHARWWI